MELDTSRLLLAFSRPLARDVLERLLSAHGLRLEDDLPGGREQLVPGEQINHTARRFWATAGHPISQETYDRLEKAALALGLEWIGPVYRQLGLRGRRALQSPLPASIMVRPRQRREDNIDLVQLNGGSALTAAAAAPVLEEVAEKSKYLNGFRYFNLRNPREVSIYEIKKELERSTALVADVQLETMPLVTPTAVNPGDALFPQQWDMARINASGAAQSGWDLSTGLNVVVCVLDTGCDLTHPDITYSGSGINLGTMSGDGAPTGNHGTACAGIVAATFNNGLGVAGVAGAARILPVAFQNWTDAEVAAGITWAVANGAMVISMSFGFNGWSHAIIDPAIANAFAANVLMAVATHNYNSAITYPATHPDVLAIGASDEIDNRKSPASPDMENWGSNFGPEISVVAPGVHIPTTDIQGGGGYNPSGGTAGDYTLTFNGTSSATPHVAGLAALLRSLYPLLTNVQVRNLIERSAAKVGTVAYADTAGRQNGSWNQEMGYGRIDVFRALDAADVMIKDAPADTGSEPFTGGNFWDFSDIVVRINDDNVFVPNDPLQSKNVERGQANYIYVRVTNSGPREARNVSVTARITPYVGLQFSYPQDWSLTDAMHVNPTPLTTTFASIPAGATMMAKFRIEAAQTESLYGWVADHSWHPCLLASVNCDNDYAFSTAPLGGDPISARRNNLAQRNLSVIDVLANAAVAFPFIMASRFDTGTSMTLMIDRSRLPAGMPLLLSIDDDGAAFPLVDFTPAGETRSCGNEMVFMDRTRVKTTLGCCTGILTLEKGSRFDCETSVRAGKVSVDGGDVIMRGERRFVELKNAITHVHIEKTPGAMYPMSLQTTIPALAQEEDQFMVQLAQKNVSGDVVGGAAAVYAVRS
jgi:hypothetical protein